VLLFGAGALATLAVGGSQLPLNMLQRLGLVQGGTTEPENKWLLNQALRLDDEVSTLLYSQHHLVPTYTKSQITPLANQLKLTRYSFFLQDLMRSYFKMRMLTR
jgi:hypothetical protein